MSRKRIDAEYASFYKWLTEHPSADTFRTAYGSSGLTGAQENWKHRWFFHAALDGPPDVVYERDRVSQRIAKLAETPNVRLMKTDPDGDGWIDFLEDLPDLAPVDTRPVDDLPNESFADYVLEKYQYLHGHNVELGSLCDELQIALQWAVYGKAELEAAHALGRFLVRLGDEIEEENWRDDIALVERLSDLVNAGALKSTKLREAIRELLKEERGLR